MNPLSSDHLGPAAVPQDSTRRDTAVINTERADNLALSLGPETYEHVVKLFMDQATNSLEEYDLAVRVHSYNEIASLSHSMKGSASTVGCDFLADIYREIEFAAKNEEADRLDQLVAELQNATLKSLDELAYRL